MRASVIVASHQEGDRLWRTLASCFETTVGLDREVIVVDDASFDGSVEEALRRFPQIRLLRSEERQGASPTKALGARHARGETLVFLDGHCKPEPGAIGRLIEDVEQLKGQAIVTPAIAALDVPRWKSAASQIGHGYFLDLEEFHCGWLPLGELRGVWRGPRKYYESPALIGCALAVGRELYENLGGFDPHLRYWGVEDLDFGLKSWLMGFSILHDPDAVVGHRFRAAFDNFSVPMEHLLANQLRMARKNFTEATWSDWVDRCRARHVGRLPDHPEGLWALAWELFQANRPSVDQERVTLLGHRRHDEFWYAERFGLEWPRLATTMAGSVPRALVVDPSASPSGSPPPPRRVVLLTGYWPPTDVGIATRPGMLRKWRQIQRDYKGSGYDVLAVSPEFAAPLGTDVNDPNVPYWGKGAGTLEVDYRATSIDFWNLVAQYNPIAIMSFSRGFANKSGELEAFGTNWADLGPNNVWVTLLHYINNAGQQAEQTWLPPYIGGSLGDPAPPSKGHPPADGNPPDPTRPAAYNRQEPANPPNATRSSNLPMAAIVSAVKASFPNPPGNITPYIDSTGGSGDFVSDFMAYHVAWYRDYINAKFPNEPSMQCLFSGHTHVGVFVAVDDAMKAVDIQIQEIFKVLPKP